jgi:hypothetical protein
MTRAAPALLAATMACFALIGAGVAQAGAVLSNGTVQLGVNDAGQLNFGNRGVTYVPTGNDGTRAGCPCEGWGAGNADADPAKSFSGFANQSQGITGVAQQSFVSDAATATSTTTVGEGRLWVTHEFLPFVGSENLYEVKVTLTNTSAETLGDVRYTRLMDWDIEPTPFQEFVTVRRGTTPALLFSNDNGFESNDPLRAGPSEPIDPATQNIDFTDSGPADHGALFDFGFGALEPDQSVTFSIFYGAAGTTADADAAISAAGAELYSYGKPSNGGVPNNALNTFIFGFRGLGGKPIIPPKLTLTPKLAATPIGTEHTVTLVVRDSARGLVPGAPIVFGVTGANPQAETPATTDDAGEATYSYTGTSAGRDTIIACLDGDGDGSCGPTEVTVKARNDYEDPIQPKTLIDSGPADGAFINDSTPTFTFSATTVDSTYECRVDAADFAPCTSPVTLELLGEGEHTFEVRATDPAAHTDASAETRTFTIDETTIDAGPLEEAWIADTAPVFEFSSGKPGSTFTCVVDGGDPFLCESPYAMSGLAEGPHTFAVAATDAFGIMDPSPATRSFTVDTTAPDTTIDAGPADAATIADSTPTFAFSSSEPVSTFVCAIDEAVAVSCDSPLESAELAEGQHTFTVTATDTAGNTDASPATRKFTVDTITPETTIDAGPLEGATITDSTPTFEFSSSESAATYTCAIDGGGTFSCGSPYTPSALADGEHTFTVTASDAAGNTDASPESRTFTVDATAPQTTIDAGPADGGMTSDSTPTLEFSADDAGSTFECALDSGDPFACDTSYTPSALEEGQHTFTVTASDGLGNADASPATRTFTVDTTLPQTTIDAGPAADATIADSTPTFEFSSSESGSTLKCTIDDGGEFSCASPFTPSALAEGQHTLTVTASDGAGNADASPATRTFTVDTTAPQTTIDAGPAAGATIADTTPTFEFSSSEPGSTFECAIDGGGTFSCDSPYTPTPRADGEHTLTVTATDGVGNTDASPATRTFTVDTTAPQTTIDAGPAAGSTITSTPTFEFSSSEPESTFECTINDGVPFSCVSPLMPALSDGEQTVTVTASDGVGNTDASPATRTFAVDTVAETTIDAGPADGSTTGDSTPAFEFSSGEAGSRFSCTVDDGAAFDCESPLTLDALADGEHTFTVAVTDGVGNTDPSPATRTFTVDTTAPQTAVEVGPANGSTTADSTPTFEFSSGEAGSTFSCSLDGGEAFSCASPFTPGALGDGVHTLTVRATDSSGNPDGTPTTRTFRVDTTPAPVPAGTPAPAPASKPAVAPTSPEVELLRCVSRRRFDIKLRPARVRLVSAVVRVNHKRVAVRKSGGRLRATVDLRGLAKATYTVTIDARDARRHHYRETRRYGVC